MTRPATLPQAWWRLVEEINGRFYLGQEGVRDPEFPCVDFAHGKPSGACESDGHYLCGTCRRRLV